MKYIVTTPDVIDNRNSEFNKHKEYGCQAILMNFGGGYNSDQMKAYKQMFLTQQIAFVLKPNNLLRQRVVNDPPRCVNEGSVFSRYWCSGPVPGEYPLSADVARQMGCVGLNEKICGILLVSIPETLIILIALLCELEAEEKIVSKFSLF